MSQIVIVTGAASGIGAELVRSHIADGDQVVAADVDSAGLAALEQRFDPKLMSICSLDVSDAVAVRKLVDETVAKYGRLDVIYNNAGVGIGGRTHDLDIEHWDRSIDVNLRGVVHGTVAALPHLLRQSSGQVVNTASLAGLIPSPGLAPYAAAKHAVVGMTLSLRVEYAASGVGFTAICPGFTDTPILDKEMPADLPSVAIPVTTRKMAESLPGGIYPVAALVEDIRRGVAENEALVVSPKMARSAWRMFRWSPGGFLKALQRRAGKTVEKFARG